MFRNKINIAGRSIGSGEPCFVIAEAGVNHNGDMDLARALIDAAARAGTDAVKFQTFLADRLATMDAPKAQYQVQADDSDETQKEMLSKLELTRQDHLDLMEHCKSRGILFLSTPFDEKSADLLDDLDLPAFKIPSGEITNLPFLEYVARKGKPMIISTGMSTMEEVQEALRVVREVGNNEVVFLHCVTNYPADPADVNLRAMATMTEVLSVPVGYSDHTLGREIPLAAVALGACVLEKHFTLDRGMPGPDHQASMEPEELKSLVKGVRKVESAMGSGRKVPSTAEEAIAKVVRKSLVSARDIPVGSVITKDDLTAKRPGTGLPPSALMSLLGKEAKVAIDEGTIITMEMLK